MGYYISVFMYLCFLSTFKIKKKNYKLIVYPVLLFLFGLREKIGADWEPYEKIFQRSQSGVVNYEIGFSILNYIVYHTTQSFNILIFLIFTINLILIMNSFSKYTRYYKLSMVLWMALGLLNFGILRQSIAISIFIYSIRFIIARDWRRYLIAVTLGAQFHVSIYALYPLFFLSKKIFSWKKIVILILSGIFFVSTNMVYKILPLLYSIPYVNRITMYIDGRRAISHFDIRILENLIILCFSYIFIKQLKSRSKNIGLFLNMHIINIIIQLYFSNFELLSLRYIKYFEVGTIVVLSEIYGVVSKTRKEKKIYLLLLCSYYLLRYIYILEKTSSIFLPYKNIFFNFFN